MVEIDRFCQYFNSIERVKNAGGTTDDINKQVSENSYFASNMKYRNLFAMEQAMQIERVEGFRDYINDVKSEKFPGPKHIVKAPEGLIDQFLAAVDGNQDE